MDWYEIAKVVHFLSLIALFGFFIIHARAGARLRRAKSRAELRTWLDMLDTTRGMIPGGALMFLVSGFAMASLRWRGPYAFLTIGLAVLVLIVLGWMFSGARHLRAIRAATGDGDGDVWPDLRRLVLDPLPWGITRALNGAALGVVIVMTMKPGWVPSLAIVVVLALATPIVLADRSEDTAATGGRA